MTKANAEMQPLLLLLLSCFSHVQLCVTLWTVAHQASLSMRFSRKEYWSGIFLTQGLNPHLTGSLPLLLLLLLSCFSHVRLCATP